MLVSEAMCGDANAQEAIIRHSNYKKGGGINIMFSSQIMYLPLISITQ
jgi:hypothetical protein